MHTATGGLRIQHWPDMLRVAGSLITHEVRAHDVLRMLGCTGHPSPLGQAFAEYGRIAKTQHLLATIDPVDDTHRRTVNTQTTVQKSPHRLARKVFHAKHGQVYQKYREGQEDQLGALGLVINATTLWNTRYTAAARTHLDATGCPVREEDAVRLSPLGYAQLNELGRYTFPHPHPRRRPAPPPRPRQRGREALTLGQQITPQSDTTERNHQPTGSGTP